MPKKTRSNTVSAKPITRDPAQTQTGSDQKALETQSQLQEAIEHYNKALKIEQIKLKKLALERQFLKKQQSSLDLELDRITSKYSIFEEDFDAFSRFMSESNFFSSTRNSDQIYQNIPLKIDELLIEISQLTDLIARQETDDNSAYLNKLLSLRAYVDNLNDMMSVTLGNKYYAKINGEMATSFEDAYYILDRDQKIVINKDCCYLLQTGEKQ